MNTEKDHPDTPSNPPSDQIKILFIIAIAIILVAIGILKGWFYPSLSKSKTQVAKSYGISRRTLMSWITKYCPKMVVGKYVHLPVQNIILNDIYPHLGEPISGVTTTKEQLAKKCFLSTSSLQRRIANIPNFYLNIGITQEDYNSMRIIPPIFFNKILYQIQLLSPESI